MIDQIEMNFDTQEDTKFKTLEPLTPLTQIVDLPGYKKTLMACLKVNNYTFDDVQEIHKKIESIDKKLNKKVDFWNDKEDDL